MGILTVNTGSSSLKVALYDVGGAGADAGATGTPDAGTPATGTAGGTWDLGKSDLDAELRLVLAGEVGRIGQSGAGMRITGADGATLLDRENDLPDHAAALAAVVAWLREQGRAQEVAAVGHRVVHGGADYSAPVVITDDVLAALRGLVPLAPDHLPQALDAIAATRAAFPDVPEVACFDTAFHHDMPQVARQYALPREVTDLGVVRYGFHGLSYEFIMSELRRLDPEAAAGRVVIAHLGNGASMAAVHAGHSRDTTMGFTPAGGLVMGTRPGDLDPGVPLYLLGARGMTLAALGDLINHQAGLLGVSGTGSDMRDLLAREADDPRAAEAVALFCYTARKHLGALAAVLGGLDTLVFTGGIGEHAAPVRARICAELEFLGIRLDPTRNAADAPVISTESPGMAQPAVTVRVMRTDEDRVIARHTIRLLRWPREGGTHAIPL